MTAFSDETGRERVTADMLRAARRKAPKFWRDYDGSEQQMRAVIEAALSASPVAQEPVATRATQQASADFLHEEMIKLGSPLTYTACLTLTKRITDTNTLAWAGEVNKLCTEIGSLKNEIAALKSAASPPATPAGLGADEKCATYRNALLWAFDRLTVTGGMNADEQRRTMREIGNVLTGKTSPAATYQPNDWDDSTALLSRAGDQGNSTQKDGSR